MKKRTLIILFSVLVVFAALFTFKVKADKNAYQVCLFSAISGTVTLHGKPLDHVKISRSANYWNKDNHADETITDAQGHFHFGPMMVNSRHISRSMNPIIFEKLIIYYDGKKYVGWDKMREDIKPNIELGTNKPIPALQCELSSKSTIKDVPIGSPINGICRW